MNGCRKWNFGNTEEDMTDASFRTQAMIVWMGLPFGGIALSVPIISLHKPLLRAIMLIQMNKVLASGSVCALYARNRGAMSLSMAEDGRMIYTA